MISEIRPYRSAPAGFDRPERTVAESRKFLLTLTGATALIVTAGPGQFLIQPQSRTRFFAKAGGDLCLDFPGPKSKPADRMVLHESGKSFVYQRVQPELRIKIEFRKPDPSKRPLRAKSRL